MAFQKVVECKRESTISGGYRYAGKLSCGCLFWRPCKWNRRQWVPDMPTKMKCRTCAPLFAAREDRPQ